jgi:hypothetical protein
MKELFSLIHNDLDSHDTSNSDSSYHTLSKITNERDLLHQDWEEFMKWKDLKIRELEQWKISETDNLELLRRDFFAWKDSQTKEIADMRRITMEEIANHKRISLEELSHMKARALEEIASMKQRAQVEIENEW